LRSHHVCKISNKTIQRIRIRIRIRIRKRIILRKRKRIIIMYIYIYIYIKFSNSGQWTELFKMVYVGEWVGLGGRGGLSLKVRAFGSGTGRPRYWVGREVFHHEKVVMVVIMRVYDFGGGGEGGG
jgi:hypothetical protein